MFRNTETFKNKEVSILESAFSETHLDVILNTYSMGISEERCILLLLCKEAIQSERNWLGRNRIGHYLTCDHSLLSSS